MTENVKNPLGTESIGKLLRQFAIPSIISMLVVSLYNIVDQFFIGRSIGELGNAATSVAFPLNTMCIAVALAFGVGGSAGFNLNLGAGKKDKAMYFIGNSVTMMITAGSVWALISLLFLEPLLVFCGASGDVLILAIEYVGIIAIGFPFNIISGGGAHLVRADGSPKFSMYCNIVGALINVVLDYLFVMVLPWGMTGAAIATVIGQVVAASMVIWYLRNYKTGKLEKKHFLLKINVVLKTIHLGMAQCCNQLAMMVVQIVFNKSFTHYGALSTYGPDIPLACTGIVMKVNQLYFSVCIGIAQAMQPIASFNRGANNIERVKKIYKLAVTCTTTISVVAFIIFQLFPLQILGLFGNGSTEYFEFGIKILRIFLFMTFINGIQPITSTFCTSIGQPVRGTFLSLTRQIIFLLPMIIVLPLVFQQMGMYGIEGLMYAAPIADGLAAVTSIIVISRVMKNLDKNRVVA